MYFISLLLSFFSYKQLSKKEIYIYYFFPYLQIKYNVSLDISSIHTYDHRHNTTYFVFLIRKKEVPLHVDSFSNILMLFSEIDYIYIFFF